MSNLDSCWTPLNSQAIYRGSWASFLDSYYCNFDPSRFLRICLDSFLIHRESFCLLDSCWIASRSIEVTFLWTPLDPSRIVDFYIKLQRDFSRSFLTLSDSSPPQTLFSHSKPLPNSIFGLKIIFFLWYDSISLIYHAFHLFLPNFWGFWKMLGLLKINEVFAKFLGWVLFKWSSMFMHCITFAF